MKALKTSIVISERKKVTIALEHRETGVLGRSHFKLSKHSGT